MIGRAEVIGLQGSEPGFKRFDPGLERGDAFTQAGRTGFRHDFVSGLVFALIKDFARHNNCDGRVLGKVDTWLVKKAPDRYKVKVPSKIFYEYVDYMRSRINKGMNISEEAVWESVSRCITLSDEGKNLRETKEEIEREVVGSIIRKFREKYRAALRYGILDSAPDIDVLLLAKELDAAVVSQDLGIQRWAEQLGLRFMESRSFPIMIKEYMNSLPELYVEEREEDKMIELTMNLRL